MLWLRVQAKPCAKEGSGGCRSCRAGAALHGSEIRGDGTMRVMVLVKATKDSETGAMPSAELPAAMGQYNEELVKAGILLAGEGLQPSARGKRVAFAARAARSSTGPSPRPASWLPASGSGRPRTCPRQSNG